MKYIPVSTYAKSLTTIAKRGKSRIRDFITLEVTVVWKKTNMMYEWGLTFEKNESTMPLFHHIVCVVNSAKGLGIKTFDFL